MFGISLLTNLFKFCWVDWTLFGLEHFGDFFNFVGFLGFAVFCLLVLLLCFWFRFSGLDFCFLILLIWLSVFVLFGWGRLNVALEEVWLFDCNLMFWLLIVFVCCLRELLVLWVGCLLLWLRLVGSLLV